MTSPRRNTPASSSASTSTLPPKSTPTAAAITHTAIPPPTPWATSASTPIPQVEDFAGDDLLQFKMKGSVGRAGLENVFDAQLQGTTGAAIYLVDPAGYKINEPLEVRRPRQGEDLHTSLDLELQIAAETALGGRTGAAVADRRAHGGGARPRLQARLLHHHAPSQPRSRRRPRTHPACGSTAPSKVSILPARRSNSSPPPLACAREPWSPVKPRSSAPDSTWLAVKRFVVPQSGRPRRSESRQSNLRVVQCVFLQVRPRGRAQPACRGSAPLWLR